jgi:plastocyanin
MLSRKYLSPLYLLSLAVAPAWGTDFVVIVGQNSSGAPALAFNPSPLTVKAGDTVTFQNIGGGTHNAHSANPAFTFSCGNSDCVNGQASAGPWVAPKLTVPASASDNTISYLCDFHGVAMTGQLVVIPTSPVTLQSFEVE